MVCVHIASHMACVGRAELLKSDGGLGGSGSNTVVLENTVSSLRKEKEEAEKKLDTLQRKSEYRINILVKALNAAEESGGRASGGSEESSVSTVWYGW